MSQPGSPTRDEASESDVNSSQNESDYQVDVDVIQTFIDTLDPRSSLCPKYDKDAGAYVFNEQKISKKEEDKIRKRFDGHLQMPFAGMPDIARDSRKGDVMSALKKLRTTHKTHWWYESIYPHDAIHKQTHFAQHALTRKAAKTLTYDRPVHKSHKRRISASFDELNQSRGMPRMRTMPTRLTANEDRVENVEELDQLAEKVKNLATEAQEANKNVESNTEGGSKLGATESPAEDLEDGEIREDTPAPTLSSNSDATRRAAGSGTGLEQGMRHDGIPHNPKQTKPKKRIKTEDSPQRQHFRNTASHLNHMDYVVWLATKCIYRCDGKTPIASSQFCLPNLSAEELHRQMKGQKMSAEAIWKNLGIKSRREKDLVEMPNIPFMIVDNSGIPLVVHLPEFFDEELTDEFTREVQSFGKDATLQKQQADVNGRGSPGAYVIRDKHLAGCINLASCWVSLGHKKNNPRPSKAAIAGAKGGLVFAFHLIQHHLSRMRRFNIFTAYALRMVDPASFWQHYNMRCNLRVRIPSCNAFWANDPSILSGRSYIFNRRTRLHFDNKEHFAGWAPLAVLGDCKTGYLSLPHLGIKIPYLPGTLELIRGRFLKHGVVGWEGKGDGDRICVANFNHETEWEFAGVQPTFETRY